MSCEPSDVVEARDDLAIGGQQGDDLPIPDVRLGGSATSPSATDARYRAND